MSSVSGFGLGTVATIGIVFAGSLAIGQHDDVVTLAAGHLSEPAIRDNDRGSGHSCRE